MLWPAPGSTDWFGYLGFSLSLVIITAYWQFPYRHWDLSRWQPGFEIRLTSEIYYNLDYMLAGLVGTLAGRISVKPAVVRRRTAPMPAVDPT